MLDLVSFSRLTDLQVLKLRGFVGLQLPSRVSVDELRCLSQLTNLTTLVRHTFSVSALPQNSSEITLSVHYISSSSAWLHWQRFRVTHFRSCRRSTTLRTFPSAIASCGVTRWVESRVSYVIELLMQFCHSISHRPTITSVNWSTWNFSVLKRVEILLVIHWVKPWNDFAS